MTFQKQGSTWKSTHKLRKLGDSSQGMAMASDGLTTRREYYNVKSGSSRRAGR